MTLPLVDDPFAVTVLSSELVFRGEVWDIRRDTVEYGDGSITREYVDHTGAVAIVALDDLGQVLLIKQYRQPLGLRDWEIPAGLLDFVAEPPLEAAKRELAEEADLVASTWNVLSDFATAPGGSNEFVRIYLARGLTATATAYDRTDEEAHLVKRWVSLDDAVDAVLSRGVVNSILSIGVLAAQASRARQWSTLGAADLPWRGRLGAGS